MRRPLVVLRNTLGQIMATIKTGVVVFATEDTREGIFAAREWLKEKALTKEAVRLYRHDGLVLVETLQPTDILPPPHQP